ncbi:DUF6801 domain-containing protein [Streptomyces sp. NPDC102406]|uniref:DUF6801 domain-containing protein n=1 Tax=Streptomyces sp. NPDC102406 TaxID=3366171 RepID=UPI00382ECDCB
MTSGGEDRMEALGRRTGLRARRSVRVASVASAALVAGVLSGSGSRADEQPAPSVELAYECSLPAAAGPQATAAPVRSAATVKVTTRLPTTAVAGRPIQPGPVQVEAVLSRAGLADLLPAGADVTSEASLGVQVRRADKKEEKADTTWAGLSGRATVPAEGDDLVLPHTGEVPTITVEAAGDLELIARDLTLTVTPASGTPVTALCSPADGDDPLLARVAVPGATETEPEDTPSSQAPGDKDGGDGEDAPDGVTVTPRAEPEPAATTCPAERPKGELDVSQTPKPPAAMEVSVYPGFGACAYAIGLAGVRKQDGSMIVNDPKGSPGLMNVAANIQAGSTFWPGTDDIFRRFDSLGELSLPDAESTFLSFGFTPVSAKVSFENTPITISTGDQHSYGDPKSYAVATFFQSLRIHDVKVNGTPLDVGPDCRTAKRFRVTLRANVGDGGGYSNVLFGGILSGKVDIPAFSGCGTGGEDLDPLFTAAISGPDNLITMNQAPVCAPELSFGCPPVMPTFPPSKVVLP